MTCEMNCKAADRDVPVKKIAAGNFKQAVIAYVRAEFPQLEIGESLEVLTQQVDARWPVQRWTVQKYENGVAARLVGQRMTTERLIDMAFNDNVGL